jgi:hypothetical protein
MQSGKNKNAAAYGPATTTGRTREDSLPAALVEKAINGAC